MRILDQLSDSSELPLEEIHWCKLNEETAVSLQHMTETTTDRKSNSPV